MPRLQIALPLPLGVEGFGEWLDLDLVEPLDPSQARHLLQLELPNELRLHTCLVVPLSGPSLSQELEGALWRFELRPGFSEGAAAAWPEAEQWEAALQTLLERKQWIWHDHDKKGRPRQRDCRPALRQLQLARLHPLEQDVELALATSIDGQGFGVRPEHVRGWLSEHLRQPLHLGRLTRVALLLHPREPAEATGD